MFSTPTTKSADVNLVYEPAEDSFLLLDALEKEKPFLDNTLPSHPFTIEIGSGSGIVTTFIHKNILPSSSPGFCFSTDLSKFACLATKQVSLENGSTPFLETIQMDLATAFRRSLFDLLVFNPPYVPGENVPSIPDTNQPNDKWLDLALVGGIDGMEVTNRLLNSLDSILSPNGIAYILFCKSNNPQKIANLMADKKWVVNKVIERRAGWEILSVWRFSRLNK